MVFSIHVITFFTFSQTNVLVHSNETVSQLKIYDSYKQTGSNDCETKVCPGMLLSTPEGCVCSCGKGLTLNASGTKCMPQLNYVDNECGAGRFLLLQSDKRQY